MKNILSLLSVAVLAMTFAAGCGKMEKCSDANGKGAKVCENKDEFKGNLACEYKIPAGKTEKEGTCEAK